MQITANNLRKTTQEHHKPVRKYYVKPHGDVRKWFEKKMPKVNHVPKLWM